MGCTVAYVVPDLAVGGLQAMVVQLIEALPRDDWRAVVYTLDGGGPLEQELVRLDVPHVPLPRSPGVDPGHARVVAEQLRRDEVDLVHCHNITALFHGARGAWRAGRIPVLFTEHDREMPAPWKHRLLHRWLARRVDRTVAVSRRLCEELVRFEGFPAQRTAALVNGIPDSLAEFAGSRSSARLQLGWDERPVILAVGSLTPVKNHESLIDALAGLRSRVPEARVVLAGEGPRLGALQQRALAVCGPDAVTFLGVRRDVPRLLAAADVFVLPSHREGLPLSLVEAHAMGRPSVAYDVGGNPEVLVHGETGLLAPPGDAAALGERLADILTDGENAAQLGAAARERYLEVFTHERMVASYMSLYRELTESQRPGGAGRN